MKIVVVMPTYNEAENIGRMIKALEDVFANISNHDMHLLVVDSNSPDGTAKIVTDAINDKKWVHLLSDGEKQGIGAAYLHGFKHAIEQLNADAIIEMDADFQHDPQELPKLIAPLDEGFDNIIGSRFVKGGSIPKSWALHRKFLSWGGSLFTKIVLGIWNIDDFSTGYKVTRVKGVLDKLDLNAINKGFAYKTEILYKLHRLGAKMKQVPIKFGLRDRGDSKMEADNFFDTLFLVLTLRLKRNKEFVKFSIVGGTGFITDAGLFNILSIDLFVPKVAALISGFVAMLVTFTLNNTWSFKERKIVKKLDVLKNILFYFGVSIIPIIFRSRLVAQFDIWFGHNFWIYNSAFIIGVILGLIWNYIIYSKVIWRKNK